MREAFYEEKRRVKENVKYNGIEEVMDTSQTDLSGEAPKHYGCSVFSKLPYEDVKVAHSETIIRRPLQYCRPICFTQLLQACRSWCGCHRRAASKVLYAKGFERGDICDRQVITGRMHVVLFNQRL